MSELSTLQSLIEWSQNPFTGILKAITVLPLRAHDPRIFACGATLAQSNNPVGGAGFSLDTAQMACLGEAIERFQTDILPSDARIHNCFSAWDHIEPAIAPSRYILFHPEQYKISHFPFQPFTTETICSWVCFREFESGNPFWIPEEIAFLSSSFEKKHQITPSISTGFSCGTWGQSVLLRGVQEILERDALMKAWWNLYAVEEWSQEEVAITIPEIFSQIQRPNLQYRFYRICSPYSQHITMVSVTGEDYEGFCFSVGSACRETLSKSWEKSLLEAIQCRYYVRYLKNRISFVDGKSAEVIDFPHHAVYYSLFPQVLEKTFFSRKYEFVSATKKFPIETLSILKERLGKNHPILFRNMTPPAIAQEFPYVYVLRVVIPGMQALHGNENFPFLGGFDGNEKTSLSHLYDFPPHPFA